MNQSMNESVKLSYSSDFFLRILSLDFKMQSCFFNYKIVCD